MELRQLQYFIKSAETENFTEAASQSFITQSTLSQQIKQLENDLGCLLFDRVGKHIRLTETGKAFLPFARQTLNDAQRGKEMLDDIQNLRTGTLRIGSTWGLSSLLTRTIIKFHQQYPEMCYQIIYRKADELIELLHEQTIDFALSFNLLVMDEQIEETKLFESTLCAVVSTDHPLAKYKRMPLAVLKDYPIAVPYKGMNARKLFDEFIDKYGLKIKPTVELSEIYTLLKLVKTSKWIAIVADSTIFDEEDVVAIPFETGRIPMHATLLQLKGVYHRNAVRAFLQVIHSFFNQ
jgi:LysR family cyn operon transcriptional activator